ncbi:MAG: Natural resistance-associated macrophage protein, partial [Gemmatimonadetes bacterium]|nr:Natural resistance-associated macrophage protein [Gemmatimonadota bacterium]
MTDLPTAQHREVQRRLDARDRPRPVGLVAFWKSLGPGIVTGAADDDPSGIATYSVAGAQYGTALLWTALFIANTINVGADLTGMADAAELLTGINSHIWVVILGVGIATATIQLRYAVLARGLKWLAFALLAYVVTALYIGPDWSVVAHDTFVPSIPKLGGGWATLVAILGTTISPYLFFWQASQEVEEEKALGRRRIEDRIGAHEYEITTRKIDIAIGTFFSNAAMFFIILATALTLHRAGMTKLETSREVAEALTPLAGRFASLLYTVGLLGTGALAIPTLAGAGAYAFAEIFHWRQGMDEPYRHAP